MPVLIRVNKRNNIYLHVTKYQGLADSGWLNWSVSSMAFPQIRKNITLYFLPREENWKVFSVFLNPDNYVLAPGVSVLSVFTNLSSNWSFGHQHFLTSFLIGSFYSWFFRIEIWRCHNSDCILPLKRLWTNWVQFSHVDLKDKIENKEIKKILFRTFENAKKLLRCKLVHVGS